MALMAEVLRWILVGALVGALFGFAYLALHKKQTPAYEPPAKGDRSRMISI